MVTSEVSPAASAVSATTTLAVGRTVSMPKLLESVVPLPALPAAFVTPELSRVMTFVVSAIPVVGVNVAVQVMPPSLELTGLNEPLVTVRSVLSKPVTASLKVMVTSEVSPAFRSSSATTMLAVGATPSTTMSLLPLSEVPEPAPGKVNTALEPSAFLIVPLLSESALLDT